MLSYMSARSATRATIRKAFCYAPSRGRQRRRVSKLNSTTKFPFNEESAAAASDCRCNPDDEHRPRAYCLAACACTAAQTAALEVDRRQRRQTDKAAVPGARAAQVRKQH